MEDRDEMELIRLSCAGDAHAFRALLDHHYLTIYKMEFHLCGHREDAEDITQMACIKVSQNIHGFRRESKFTTWLYTIVLNTFRDWADNRANTGKGRVDIDDVAAKMAGNDNPEKAAEVNEQLRKLDALTQPEREAVILIFGQGYSHKEAADMLGVAESTISWRIHEVRKKLASPEEGAIS